MNNITLKNLKLEIEKYNKELLENEKIRKQRKEVSFKIINGSLPIILSAPHAVRQLRENKIKSAEGETGAIVQILAKETGCYAIYKTYNNDDDANYDLDSKYKKELSKIIETENIKLLLDIHGAKNEHDFNIEICTDDGENINYNKELVYSLKKCFEKEKIDKITENTIFKANSIRTISKYIHEETNIPCIQLEITGRYRYIENLEGIQKLLNSLKEYIKCIKEKGII